MRTCRAKEKRKGSPPPLVVPRKTGMLARDPWPARKGYTSSPLPLPRSTSCHPQSRLPSNNQSTIIRALLSKCVGVQAYDEISGRDPGGEAGKQKQSRYCQNAYLIEEVRLQSFPGQQDTNGVLRLVRVFIALWSKNYVASLMSISYLHTDTWVP